MTEEQIIEDAKAAGLTISASGDILMEYYGDWIVITDALTKFAQLQAARQFNHSEAVDCTEILKETLRQLKNEEAITREQSEALVDKITVLLNTSKPFVYSLKGQIEELIKTVSMSFGETKVHTVDIIYASDLRALLAVTSPPQTTDILEEVIKILDGHIDRASTLGQQEEFREAQARIRNLITQPESEGK